MDSPKLTGSQCRAARALLGWSQDDLAGKSKVAKKTLALFERDEREPYDRTRAKLRTTLEKGDGKGAVVFIDENGDGPGVRLKKR
jgi:transcriptional regulator with XRE-family HTH domain